MFILFRASENAFFPQSANRLRREGHRDFLAIDEKSLFLEIGLEYSLGATQREADVVSVLLAFTGEFAS
jgi:hypothetical protein